MTPDDFIDMLMRVFWGYGCANLAAVICWGAVKLALRWGGIA